MPNAHHLVNQLVDLTALRDQELLDFSLLKTVDSFLSPHSLELLKIDAKDRPLMQVTIVNRQCQVARDGIRYCDDAQRAITQIGLDALGELCVTLEQGFLYAYSLYSSRTARAFLIIRVRQTMSRLDAHLIAGLLQIYRNFCDLLQESQSDQLTGLANRKTFDDCIQKVWKLMPPVYDDFPLDRRAPPSEQIWLVMIDIDHFKQINDRFGHLYGDEVLLLLAQLLKAMFRDDDMVFRFGGEEFVVILRCPNRETCAAILERLRASIEQRQFPQVGTVTVSMGVTQMQREVYAITLLDYADQALYSSKQNGRNRITFFEDMLASGAAQIQQVEAGGITFL